jgi:hypothetical protein
MVIVNLTQHDATAEQLAAGVVELSPRRKAVVRALLTFDALPSAEEIAKRAHALACHAGGHLGNRSVPFPWGAMIGGAPYLMGPLEAALKANSIEPRFAFSRRESVDEVQADGSVRKVAVFRHEGFV